MESTHRRTTGYDVPELGQWRPRSPESATPERATPELADDLYADYNPRVQTRRPGVDSLVTPARPAVANRAVPDRLPAAASEAPQPSSPWGAIPPNILLRIFKRVDWNTFISASHVNRHWQSASRDEATWTGYLWGMGVPLRDHVLHGADVERLKDHAYNHIVGHRNMRTGNAVTRTVGFLPRVVFSQDGRRGLVVGANLDCASKATASYLPLWGQNPVPLHSASLRFDGPAVVSDDGRFAIARMLGKREQAKFAVWNLERQDIVLAERPRRGMGSFTYAISPCGDKVAVGQSPLGPSGRFDYRNGRTTVFVYDTANQTQYAVETALKPIDGSYEIHRRRREHSLLAISDSGEWLSVLVHRAEPYSPSPTSPFATVQVFRFDGQGYRMHATVPLMQRWYDHRTYQMAFNAQQDHVLCFSSFDGDSEGDITTPDISADIDCAAGTFVNLPRRDRKSLPADAPPSALTDTLKRALPADVKPRSMMVQSISPNGLTYVLSGAPTGHLVVDFRPAQPRLAQRDPDPGLSPRLV